MCNVVKEHDEQIVKSAMEYDMGIGCMVENMKVHILSELCLIQNEYSIPSLRECRHSGTMRYKLGYSPVRGHIQVTSCKYITF